jgi:PilZ domain
MLEMQNGRIDRRVSVREPGPFAGAVRLYSGQSIACTVVNLSASGAKLRLAKESLLPKEFELSVPALNVSWLVRLVWQQRKELGVARL